MNCPLKIPTGFHPLAQGWNNPGDRVVGKSQPPWGCVNIGPPPGHNPGGIDDNQSRGPRVARASLWVAIPLGLQKRQSPQDFACQPKVGTTMGIGTPPGCCGTIPLGLQKRQSPRDFILQPKVAATRLPWENEPTHPRPNPNGVVPTRLIPCRNPFPPFIFI